MSEDNTLNELKLNSFVLYVYIILAPFVYDVAAAYIVYLFTDNVNVFIGIVIGALLGIIIHYIFIAKDEIGNLEYILNKETEVDYNRVEKKHVIKYLYDWIVDIDKIPYISLHIVVFIILSVVIYYMNTSAIIEYAILITVTALFVFISNTKSGPVKYVRDEIDTYVYARDLIVIKHGKK